MSNEYVSFRPNVTVVLDSDSDTFRLVFEWEDSYQGPFDEDGDRTEMGEMAQDWLDAMISENPILRGTPSLVTPGWPLGELAEPVKLPQPFLTCRHFCPSSEQTDLAGPPDFEFDKRFPFPNCSNRAIMPNGFGPCRAYGRNMPSCIEYQPEEPVPVKLITTQDGRKTLIRTARISLGTPATILSDPDEPDVFTRYDGTVDEAVADLVDLGGEASDPEVEKRPSFLAGLVGAGHAQR